MNTWHQKQLTPVAATMAAAALGFGTILGAASPARAALPQHDVQCVQGPAVGQPGLAEDSPWKAAHGTAPIPFSGLPAAGGMSEKVMQTAPGSDRFRIESGLKDHMGVGPAPDGKYEVKIGNGLCGTDLTASAADGILDLSQAQDFIAEAHGQLMVQVKGPLNPDAATNADRPYLDLMDRPTKDIPALAQGGIAYDSSNLTVPVDSAGNSARDKSTGLPVHDVGTDDIPLMTTAPLPVPNTANISVDASYRDAATGEVVTVPHAAYLGRNAQGQVSIQQGQLADLPSGRYTFSFTDDDGAYHQVVVLLADGNHQDVPGESQLYSDPF